MSDDATRTRFLGAIRQGGVESGVAVIALERDERAEPVTVDVDGGFVPPPAVADGTITDGIMHALVTHDIPFVLTGSIRDDGPLPDVITDALAGQDAMKRHTVRATMAVLVATALHAIATGNMLPAFVTEADGSLRELSTICVDSAEFVVSKLKDRGTHQAFGVVTNAQDFMHILRLYVERELDTRRALRQGPASGATSPAGAR